MYTDQTPEQALAALSGTAEGLTQEEAAKRLLEYGENEIEQSRRRKAALFVSRLKDPLLYILIVSSGIMVLLEMYMEAAVFSALVVLKIVFTAVWEIRSSVKLGKLIKLSAPMAKVRRGGKILQTDAAGLVPGDIVLLEAGHSVPADVRILISNGLAVDESGLTGECEAVHKHAEAIAGGRLPLRERFNMAFMFTNVVSGEGEGVVTATALQSETGRLAGTADTDEEGPVPIGQQLDGLVRMHGLITAGVCVLLIAAGMLRGQGFGLMLLAAISLIAASVIHGMPSLVTAALAAGIARITKGGAFVRHVHAADILGSVNYLCLDEAGVLTHQRMYVKSLYMNGEHTDISAVDLHRHALMLQGFVLCNNAQLSSALTDDPAEYALLCMASEARVDVEKIRSGMPCIAKLRHGCTEMRMSTLHRAPNGQTISYTKGELDAVMPEVSHIVHQGSIREITQEDIDALRAEAAMLCDRGQRVTVLAARSGDDEIVEKELVFIGLAGLCDTPREGVEAAISRFRQAGITVLMIASGSKSTAAATAKEFGIVSDRTQILSGEELDLMREDELMARVQEIRVLAHAAAGHKHRVVRALKALGHTVCVTGGTLEDIQALRTADLGMAMGDTGDDAARIASDIVISKGDISALPRIVEEGRSIYLNIRKSILYLFACHAGEAAAIFAAVLLGMGLLLSPIHILLASLLGALLPALALGIDAADMHIMKQMPVHSEESLFAHGGWVTVVLNAAAIAAVTLGAYVLGLSRYEGLETRELHAQTYAFVVLVVALLFCALGMRTQHRSVFASRLHKNPLMPAVCAAGAVVLVLIVSIPAAGALFGTTPLGLHEWGLLAAFASAPLVVHEAGIFIRYFSEKFDGE